MEQHFLQLLAWLAAAVGVTISAIQLIFGWRRERRERDVSRAKFGYDLLDGLFADEWAGEFLYAIDDVRTRRRSTSGPQLATDFVLMFAEPPGGVLVPADREMVVYSRLDATLYFFDRFEHAIQAGLTTFETVETPTRYYVRLLKPYQGPLKRYIRDVGYCRVIEFLGRFDATWEKLPERGAA